MASRQDQERALEIVAGIVRDFRSPETNLKALLRQCQEACHLIEREDWGNWAKHELYGYPQEMNVPIYRNGMMITLWKVSDAPFDRYNAILAGETQAQDIERETFVFREGIEQLLSLSQRGIQTPTGQRERRWLARSDDKVTFEQWRYAPQQVYTQMIDGIEQNLHRFALDIEKQLRAIVAQPAVQTSSLVTQGASQFFSSYLKGLMMASTPPIEITESLQRFKRDHPDPAKTAFLMMQFGATTLHAEMVKAIRETGQKHGIAVLRADDKEYHGDLYLNVLTYMHGSGFGIALFERLVREDFNPNVSLEIGYMLALRKLVCLLKDNTLRALQTDLVGQQYRSFDPQNAAKSIPEVLERWMSDRELLGSVATSSPTNIVAAVMQPIPDNELVVLRAVWEALQNNNHELLHLVRANIEQLGSAGQLTPQQSVRAFEFLADNDYLLTLQRLRGDDKLQAAVVKDVTEKGRRKLGLIGQE